MCLGWAVKRLLPLSNYQSGHITAGVLVRQCNSSKTLKRPKLYNDLISLHQRKQAIQLIWKAMDWNRFFKLSNRSARLWKAFPVPIGEQIISIEVLSNGQTLELIGPQIQEFFQILQLRLLANIIYSKDKPQNPLCALHRIWLPWSCFSGKKSKQFPKFQEKSNLWKFFQLHV